MAYGPPQTLYVAETPASVTAIGTGAFGHDVTMAVAGRITAMRYYWAATSVAATRQLRIWSSAGVQLGNVAIPRGTAGSVGWTQVSLSTPLTTTAGQVVRIVMELSSASEPVGRTNSLAADVVYGDLTRHRQLYSGLANAYPTGALSTRNYFVDVIFEALIPAVGGRPKVYTGGTWTAKPAKVHAGGTWTEKPMKRHNGTTWVPIT